MSECVRERVCEREREKENDVVQKLADCDLLLRFIAEIEVMGILIKKLSIHVVKIFLIYLLMKFD